MDSKRLLRIALLSLSVLSSPAEAVVPDHLYLQPQYLPPQLLPPPPADGGKARDGEIKAVLNAQKTVSASDRAAMKADQNVRVESITSLMGPNFKRDRFPKTYFLLEQVLSGTTPITDAARKFWHIRPPYMADDRIVPFVDPPKDGFSYPCTSATRAYVLAEVMGLLVPEKVAAFRNRASSLARKQLETGTSYPSDIEGAQTLATLIVGALTSNDFFQDDLNTARKEIWTK